MLLLLHIRKDKPIGAPPFKWGLLPHKKWGYMIGTFCCLRDCLARWQSLCKPCEVFTLRASPMVGTILLDWLTQPIFQSMLLLLAQSVVLEVNFSVVVDVNFAHLSCQASCTKINEGIIIVWYYYCGGLHSLTSVMARIYKSLASLSISAQESL